MIETIFFDVDDTLYDQILPFKDAFQRVFKHTDVPIDEVYKLSRYYSDLVFDQTERRDLSLREMHIYRIKSALHDYGITISDEEALTFQKDYESNQASIKLDERLARVFDVLRERSITLGIITNGPKKHQKNKIEQLGLYKWFDQKSIFISSEVGIAKPSKHIFDLARGKWESNNCLYVGDSFENDVVGAKLAGWESIWFNRRNRLSSNSELFSNYQVEHLDKLCELLLKITL